MFGSSGGGSKTKNWGPQYGRLKDIWHEAQRITDTPLEYYKGQAIYDQDPQTKQAIEAMKNWGQGRGADLQALYSGQAQRLLPGLQRAGQMPQRIYDRSFKYDPSIAQGIVERGQGTFSPLRSRTGTDPVSSRIQQKGLADRTSRSRARGQSQLYSTGRGIGQQAGLQNLAAGMATDRLQQGADIQSAKANLRLGKAGLGLLGQGLGQQERNIGLLSKAGLMEQQQLQRLINEDMKKFNFNQRAPWEQMDFYRKMIGNPIVHTKTKPGGATALGNIAKLGLTAVGTYFGGPMGGAAGAAAGDALIGSGA